MTLLEASARIAELKRKMAAATPGPWQTRFMARLFKFCREFGERHGFMMQPNASRDWADADLTASSVNALPILLSGMETLVMSVSDAVAMIRATPQHTRQVFAEVPFCRRFRRAITMRPRLAGWRFNKTESLQSPS